MTNSLSFMNMKLYQPDLNFRERKLCFIDLEFTGLDASKHEILSIAAILVEPGTYEVLKEKEWKVKIEHPENFDPKAKELLKYDEQDWSTAIPLKDVLEDFNKFANYATLVGFNIAFDWAFLHRDFERTRVKPMVDWHMMDIMIDVYKYFYDKKRPKLISLRSVARELGIKISDVHGALSDTRATYEIFKKLN